MGWHRGAARPNAATLSRCRHCASALTHASEGVHLYVRSLKVHAEICIASLPHCHSPLSCHRACHPALQNWARAITLHHNAPNGHKTVLCSNVHARMLQNRQTRTRRPCCSHVVQTCQQATTCDKRHLGHTHTARALPGMCLAPKEACVTKMTTIREQLLLCILRARHPLCAVSRCKNRPSRPPGGSPRARLGARQGICGRASVQLSWLGPRHANTSGVTIDLLLPTPAAHTLSTNITHTHHG